MQKTKSILQPWKWCEKALMVLAVSFVLVMVMPLQSNARANSLVSYREALEKTREAQQTLAAHHSRPHRHRLGRHVCARNSVVNTPLKQRESYNKPAYKSYRRACEDNSDKICTSYRIIYETAYRTVYKSVPRTETTYECCPGWTRRSPAAHGCMEAICSHSCKNGGTCSRPNQCSCLPGWTGRTCEKVENKCLKHNGNCEHKCVNTPGSYSCECHDGFILQKDGKSCKMNLHTVPEYQKFVQDYQELNQRIVVLEKMQAQHNLTDLEHRVQKIAEAVSSMTEKSTETPSYSSALEGNTKEYTYPFYGSPWERVHSLSEQISMLEERLADCTCSEPQRRRPNF
ncbi:epidermal growth factor-like protein 8 isoform X1 [Tachypleus tridentatus]|uniref:epidermal growth factor-like protein 8 isoform X1 n=1 Tax=Tachypleus tridentatus TaxID=6853 RepID=UPI003FD50628